jgi:hypothetical protein
MYANTQRGRGLSDPLEKTLADPAYLKWKSWFDGKLAEDLRAKESLTSLADKCDVELIWQLLWRLSNDPQRPARDDWHYMYGFDRRSLMKVEKVLSKAANLLDKLNRAAVPKEFLLLPELGGEQVSLVPVILRAYLGLLTKAPKELKRRPKDKHYSSLCRAILIQHVQKRMGRPFDSELADLYGIAAGKEGYSAENWADSRRANPHLAKTRPTTTSNPSNRG